MKSTRMWRRRPLRLALFLVSLAAVLSVEDSARPSSSSTSAAKHEKVRAHQKAETHHHSAATTAAAAAAATAASRRRQEAFLYDASQARLAEAKARTRVVAGAKVKAAAYPSPPPKVPVNPSGLVNPNPRKGQPAQFDPVIMAAAQTAMMLKAKGPPASGGAPADPFNNVAVVAGGFGAAGVPIHPTAMGAQEASMSSGGGGGPGAAPAAPPGVPLGNMHAVPQSPTISQLVDATSTSGQGMNGNPGTGVHPVLAAALTSGGPPAPPSRGQPVANPVVGAAPTVLQHPALHGLNAGTAANPFTARQPSSVAFSTNPLAYHPGSTVSHPSAVAAAAVVQTSVLPPLTSSYMGGNLPYHIDQAMVNGAERAREYLTRSMSAVRPGEGLGYGAGAFPPLHTVGLPPRYGGSVNGFPTRYGMPGAGVAAGIRVHQMTPGFTPHGGTPVGLPIETMFLEEAEQQRLRQRVFAGAWQHPQQQQHVAQHPQQHVAHRHYQQHYAQHPQQHHVLSHQREALAASSPKFRRSRFFYGSMPPINAPFLTASTDKGPAPGSGPFIPYPVKEGKEPWKNIFEKGPMGPKSPFGPGLISPKFEKDPTDKEGKRFKPVVFPQYRGLPHQVVGAIPYGGGGYPAYPGAPWASPSSPQALGYPAGAQPASPYAPGLATAPPVSGGTPNSVNGDFQGWF